MDLGSDWTQDLKIGEHPLYQICHLSLVFLIQVYLIEEGLIKLCTIWKMVGWRKSCFKDCLKHKKVSFLQSTVSPFLHLKTLTEIVQSTKRVKNTFKSLFIMYLKAVVHNWFPDLIKCYLEYSVSSPGTNIRILNFYLKLFRAIKFRQ